MKNRNEELLKSFVEYCNANPSMRFWQALRNFAQVSRICVQTTYVGEQEGKVEYQDTFYWETKDGSIPENPDSSFALNLPDITKSTP